MALHQLLDLIEGEDIHGGADIYIQPPNTDLIESELDSDSSDQEVGDINHLPRGILSQECEISFHNDEENHPIIQESESDDDNLPLSVIRERLLNNKKAKKYSKSKKTHDWTARDLQTNINTTFQPVRCSEQAQSAESPVDFFTLFFTEDVMKNIVEQTNIYGSQKNKTLNFSIQELYVLFGGLLLSGYAKYPNKRMFWNASSDTPEMLQDAIRLNRFELLLRHLHFNNNNNISTDDRLFKLRPLIEALNNNFGKHGGLDEHLSIDESMIPYYGRHYAKQYIKGKPIRFGYKNWALCQSEGYMIAFDIYTGKSDKEKQFGLGGDTVISLIKLAGVAPNTGFKLYFDNYFTGIGLLSHLAENQICATGTIRQNRLEGCPFPDKFSWSKKPRGDHVFLSNGHILMTQWKDNKVVTIATNFDDKSLTTTKRWNKETKSRQVIPQPRVISNYNKFMGGVDKMDGLIAAYRSRMRQRKWYWPIFLYLFDASVVNGWLLMKKLKPSDPNCTSLLVFRRYIAVHFLQKYGSKPLRQQRQLSNIGDMRFDNVGHLIEYSENDKKCKVCHKNSKFICKKCKIGLHPKICFLFYHTK